MGTDTRRSPLPGRFLEQTGAFAARALRTLRRNGAVVFWSVAFPALFYLLTVYLLINTSSMPAEAAGIVKATNAISYGTFAALVVFLNTFSQSLVADVEGGRYAQFRALPVSPGADFFGRFVAAYAFAVVAVAVVLAVGVATGATFGLQSVISIPVVLLGLLALGLFAASIAVVLVAAVPEPKFASIITITLVLLAFFLTGYNGVQPALVASTAEFVNYVPNGLATRLAVYHLVPVGDWAAAGLAEPSAPTAPRYLALLAAYAVAGAGVAVIATRRSLYRGEIQ
ncbi:ABC transporter permease [Halolamina sp. CBA1230]|uniref:ABC transporter permease n=1 Tax=Halolamina sp. CBA1230 TaxID=1853690 RepID=UPI0009A20624|nr:ABC transporter permease [Halolamina sp. CBA1230]QKY20677.1 ABC transporter permease [Halolamina sp. CBA1230]